MWSGAIIGSWLVRGPSLFGKYCCCTGSSDNELDYCYVIEKFTRIMIRLESLV